MFPTTLNRFGMFLAAGLFLAFADAHAQSDHNQTSGATRRLPLLNGWILGTRANCYLLARNHEGGPLSGSTFSSHPQSRSGWLIDADMADAGCPSLAEERPGSAGLNRARDGDRFAA